MIDIHSHLIPEIDDGAKDIETTIKMIEIYKQQGVDNVIATPHYFPPYFENTKEIITKKVEEINSKLNERNIDFNIYPGSEIFGTKEVYDEIKKGNIQTLNNSRYILMEFDYKHFPDYGMDLIYELHLLGYRVIIAHPERYYYIIKEPMFLNTLIDEGCLIQLNTTSITGLFGKDVQKTALRIIENGAFNFIATDAHTTNGRGPFFEKSFELIKKINKDFSQNMSKETEKLIKNVEICNKLNKIKEKRSIFNIFKEKGI